MGWFKPRRRVKARVFWPYPKLIFLALIAFLVLLGIRSYLNSTWLRQASFNMVWAPSPTMILGVSPAEKSLTVLLIKRNVTIETVGGYGFYPIGSIYDLGKLVGRKEKFLADSVQEYFGIPVDGWLIRESEKSNGAVFSLAKMKSDLVASLDGGSKAGFFTNLSFFDRARLWWYFSFLRPDKVTVVELGEFGQTDQPQIEKLLGENFAYSDLAKEGKTVAVLNGTSFFGLASKAARLLKNMGVRVVWVGEGESLSARCLVEVKEGNLQGATALRIKKVFACEKIVAIKGEARADIILTVGEAYYQYLLGS